jgi:fibronectin type 3 domain-containing protein
LSVGRKVLKIDIPDISSGSYILRLRVGDEVVMEKFVKRE